MKRKCRKRIEAKPVTARTEQTVRAVRLLSFDLQAATIRLQQVLSAPRPTRPPEEPKR